MVIIDFNGGDDWYAANWIFRQLRADILEDEPGDVDLHHELEKAQAFGDLSLDSMEPSLASRILRVMRSVAEKTLDGSIPGWRRTRPDDEGGQRTYLEAVAELLAILQRQPDGGYSGIVPEEQSTIGHGDGTSERDDLFAGETLDPIITGVEREKSTPIDTDGGPAST